jgi:hypothetical protein
MLCKRRDSSIYRVSNLNPGKLPARISQGCSFITEVKCLTQKPVSEQWILIPPRVTAPGDAGVLSHATHAGEDGQNAMADALNVPFALNVAKTAFTRRRKSFLLLRE